MTSEYSENEPERSVDRNELKAEKPLAEMSLEGLWHLFPIVLVPHDNGWVSQFEEEAQALKTILAGKIVKSINHIGSTAVDVIWAKPIVDILIELDISEDMPEVSRLLTSNGYICMNRSGNRISLNKGYTPDGFAEKVFHIHLRHDGDCPEIRFRDILRARPEIAKEYESLKLSLWGSHQHLHQKLNDGFVYILSMHLYVLYIAYLLYLNTN